MKSKHDVRREIRLKRESLTEEEKVRRSLLVAARALELLEKEEQVYVYRQEQENSSPGYGKTGSGWLRQE